MESNTGNVLVPVATRFTGHVASNDRRTFVESDVKRWGRIASHGDARTFLVAELNDGALIQVGIGGDRVRSKRLASIQKPYVGSDEASSIAWQGEQYK